MVILKSLTPFLSGIRTGSNWNLDIYVQTKSTFQYVEICPCTHKKAEIATLLESAVSEEAFLT